MGSREERRAGPGPNDEQALGVRPREMASRERGGGCGAPECKPRPVDRRQRLAGAARLQHVEAGDRGQAAGRNCRERYRGIG